MLKREIGISVYPEHFTIEETKNYLKQCKDFGYQKLFMSMIHFGSEPNEKIIELYQEVIDYAKNLKYYIILDVNDNAFKFLEVTLQDLQPLKKMGINCIRLDSPVLPADVAKLTYQDLDIQINISNNDNFITNIMDYRPFLANLQGSHNFYPFVNTAMGVDFFMQSTKRFTDFGLSTMAFVGSALGNRGPQKEIVHQLVSVEILRKMPILSQAKWLFATNLISSVIVGNQAMELSEIKELIRVLDMKKFIFDLQLDIELSQVEKEVLQYQNHFWRGDTNESFVRSTMTRVEVTGNVEPNNTPEFLNYGDVCIINKNNYHYQKELAIVLKDRFVNDNLSFNKIGHIKDYDLPLFALLKGWDKFAFEYPEKEG